MTVLYRCFVRKSKLVSMILKGSLGSGKHSALPSQGLISLKVDIELKRASDG